MPVWKARGRRGLQGEGEDLSSGQHAPRGNQLFVSSVSTTTGLNVPQDIPAGQSDLLATKGYALSKRLRFWMPRAYIRVMNPTAPKPATHEKTAARVRVSVQEEVPESGTDEGTNA